MIEALDEITEIPFNVFWDKFMDLEPRTSLYRS